jgi:hypothetical protein
MQSLSPPRERIWDIPAPKINPATQNPMCPGRLVSAVRSHSAFVDPVIVPLLPQRLDGARTRFAVRPLARMRTPALLNRSAPSGGLLGSSCAFPWLVAADARSCATDYR